MTPDDDRNDGPYCLCGAEMEREECYSCAGDGFDGHDCGEDCCNCLHPDDNVICGICGGNGGWWLCPDGDDATLTHGRAALLPEGTP